ncbi:MAG: chemotaxis response regulator protein-glutamate methylesterase [Spirochaetales bacterium]|nr:chemotaxis response regulator protein-glutamate methylesterase [Spirochaetales bacterium]
MNNGRKIRVLIIDDSAIVRAILSDSLQKYPDMEIVGMATDPYVARDKILSLKPDILTLDIEMPRMDGLTFLQRLNKYYPIPVIIVSSVTTKDPGAVIKALEMGAVDVVNKPSGNLSVDAIIDEIHYKIVQADKIRDNFLTRRSVIQMNLSNYRQTMPRSAIEKSLKGVDTTDKIIAIGASTGGTSSIEFLIKNFPPYLPPVLIVQHMPEGYTFAFAKRLNELSGLTVKEAAEGELVTAGSVYIAKGNYHMTVCRKGAYLYIAYNQEQKINFQRPAVDVLFDSLANTAGKNVLAFLLTGMGSDGAKGLKNLKNAGAYTVCQDEASCIVWGMPRAAVELDAHREEMPLTEIPEKLPVLLKKI